MIKNRSGQDIGAQMLNATNGSDYVGTVTVYITGDGGTQTQGTVDAGSGAGVCTAEGNGYFSYKPSQAETNFNHIAFTFKGTGAISVTVQVDTITEGQNASLSQASGATAMTVRDLLTASLRRIGVVAQGVTPQAETMSQALLAFNVFVDALAANNLSMYGETRTTWSIVSGTRDYDVGVGQAINRVRPPFLMSLGDVSPVRYYDSALSTPVELPLPLLSEQEWRSVSMKTLQSALPTNASYEPTFPYGTVSLVPTPTSSGLIGVLYAPTQLGQFALSDSVSLPPGYRRFLLTNVAVELCAEFDRQVPGSLAAAAQQAKADIERLNMTLVEMSLDPMWSSGSGGLYNIFSDTNGR